METFTDNFISIHIISHLTCFLLNPSKLTEVFVSSSQFIMQPWPVQIKKNLHLVPSCKSLIIFLNSWSWKMILIVTTTYCQPLHERPVYSYWLLFVNQFSICANTLHSIPCTFDFISSFYVKLFTTKITIIQLYRHGRIAIPKLFNNIFYPPCTMALAFHREVSIIKVHLYG